jgi:hypothetical protein
MRTKTLHIEIENNPAHLNEEDLTLTKQVIEEQGWTCQVVDQELLRKGPWEIWFHVASEVSDPETSERLKVFGRHILAVMRARIAARGDATPRRVRILDEREQLLWPPDLTRDEE